MKAVRVTQAEEATQFVAAAASQKGVLAAAFASSVASLPFPSLFLPPRAQQAGPNAPNFSLVVVGAFATPVGCFTFCLECRKRERLIGREREGRERDREGPESGRNEGLPNKVGQTDRRVGSQPN